MPSGLPVVGVVDPFCCFTTFHEPNSAHCRQLHRNHCKFSVKSFCALILMHRLNLQKHKSWRGASEESEDQMKSIEI